MFSDMDDIDRRIRKESLQDLLTIISWILLLVLIGFAISFGIGWVS